MNLDAKRRARRKYQAIAGTIIFGAALPIAAFGLTVWSDALGENWLYGILGIAFAAYVLHAFLLDRHAHSPLQWVTVASTAVIGSLFFVWFVPVCDGINTLSNPHPRPTPMGEPGDLGIIGWTLGSVLSGAAMSLLLWAATRNWRVGLVLLGISAACGFLAFIDGLTSIPWNTSFAAVLYSWACRRQLSWKDPGPPTCDHCGYSLYGLSASTCPECGKAV